MELCTQYEFNLVDRFAIDEPMLGCRIITTLSDTTIPLCNGHAVTSVFPVVTLSCDMFVNCSISYPLIGAVTDGDTTMWKRFQIHLPPWTYDPLHQFCDWHKGQNLKKEGERLLAQAHGERTRMGAATYDETFTLGHILGDSPAYSPSFTRLFGPLLHVVRRHDSLPVAELFWDLFVTKASLCGMLLCDNFASLHHFQNGTSGRYGMSTWGITRATTLSHEAPPFFMVKYGCGLTANSLESRANKQIKRDLETKLGFVAIHAIVKKSCSSQCRQTCSLGFSVRQACAGDSTQTYIARSHTYFLENPIGTNWKAQWPMGLEQSKDEFWTTYVWESGTCWQDYTFTIATDVAVKVCMTMHAYYADTTKTLRQYCTTLMKDWKCFKKDPIKYRSELEREVMTFDLLRARNHLLNASAYPKASKKWRPSKLEMFAIVEKDLLFQQTAFVVVRCNEVRLNEDQSVKLLREPWRKCSLINGRRVPVDYQAFICQGCKNFNAYGFCVHCVMSGLRIARGMKHISCTALPFP